MKKFNFIKVADMQPSTLPKISEENYRRLGLKTLLCSIGLVL